MGKSRVAVRLKEKVRGSKSHNKSEDLTRLTEKYDAFCKRLQSLVNVRSIVSMKEEKKRRAFKKHIKYPEQKFQKKSPLYSHFHILSLSSSSSSSSSSLHQRH